METQRWINRGQPQTLVIAVFLMYMDAAFTAVFGLLRGWLVPALLSGSILTLYVAAELGGVAAAWGIANERKWGYVLGLVIAVVGLAVVLLGVAGGGLLSLVFAVAKLALLLHPQSRDYQKIWFK